MSILVYTETQNGKFKKNAYEAVSFAHSIAEANGEGVTALAFSPKNAEELYKYGAEKVLTVEGAQPSPEILGSALSHYADGDFVILSHSNEGATVAPFAAITLDAALITNIIHAPISVSPLKVERKAFSGKGVMTATTEQGKKVLTIAQNSFGIKENPVSGSTESVTLEAANGKLNIESTETSSGTLDLKEADLVVSAGRGMKGPENWGMIEDLAKELGAATACSKPVADIGWRPHGEHVGQTGKAIAPNLYIAIGISGAIQHLAGVNSSKNIVVINTDPEAPFFKSADYGIVGDAFEVVPKLVEEIKKYKTSH